MNDFRRSEQPRKAISGVEDRIDELDKFFSGVNRAAHIMTPTAGARMLNLDDAQYYLFNRKRVLQNKRALTPKEWFEAER